MPKKQKQNIRLIRDGIKVLYANKKLLLFPLVSTLISSVFISLLARQFAQYEELVYHLQNMEWHKYIILYIVLLIVLFLVHFIIYFFNAALTYCIQQYFNQQKTSLKQGMRAAWNIIGRMYLWHSLSSTIGIVLHIFYEKTRKIRFVKKYTFGQRWTVATSLIVPIILFEQTKSLASLQKSASLMTQTWGYPLKQNFGFGCLMQLLRIFSFAPLIIAFYIGGSTAILIGFCITVFFEICWATLSNAIRAVFVIALYVYATQQQVVTNFDEQSLKLAYIIDKDVDLDPTL